MKGDCLRRSPSAWLSACSAALVLCAAGCGGEEAPTLERSVADRLAKRSDAVADAIERNDGCRARDELAQLAAELRSDEVPAAIRREAEQVVARTSPVCTPTPPPPPPPPPPPVADEQDDEGEENGRGKGKGKKKGKKKDREEDED